ncbi:hypothetical protein DL96DRAFT_1703157 [Flagelloscypha sp. PMI_526]|nr:hypothetical protein DL96DRAFT_1703157 [Flagelloscypha sp. PMI_526]
MVWRSLPPSERQKWEEKARVAQVEHRLKYPDWRFTPGLDRGAGQGGIKRAKLTHLKDEESRRLREDVDSTSPVGPTTAHPGPKRRSKANTKLLQSGTNEEPPQVLTFSPGDSPSSDSVTSMPHGRKRRATVSATPTIELRHSRSNRAVAESSASDLSSLPVTKSRGSAKSSEPGSNKAFEAARIQKIAELLSQGQTGPELARSLDEWAVEQQGGPPSPSHHSQSDNLSVRGRATVRLGRTTRSSALSVEAAAESLPPPPDTLSPNAPPTTVPDTNSSTLTNILKRSLSVPVRNLHKRSLSTNAIDEARWPSFGATINRHSGDGSSQYHNGEITVESRPPTPSSSPIRLWTTWSPPSSDENAYSPVVGPGEASPYLNSSPNSPHASPYLAQAAAHVSATTDEQSPTVDVPSWTSEPNDTSGQWYSLNMPPATTDWWQPPREEEPTWIMAESPNPNRWQVGGLDQDNEGHWDNGNSGKSKGYAYDSWNMSLDPSTLGPPPSFDSPMMSSPEPCPAEPVAHPPQVNTSSFPPYSNSSEVSSFPTPYLSTYSSLSNWAGEPNQPQPAATGSARSTKDGWIRGDDWYSSIQY